MHCCERCCMLSIGVGIITGKPAMLLDLVKIAIILLGINSDVPKMGKQCETFSETPKFQPVQTELFNADGGQALAWADANGDGWLDLIVGFQNRPLRLYLQDEHGFTEQAGKLGLPNAAVDTRTLAWGDYNKDGLLDLYLGFGRDSGYTNKLYRGGPIGFTEVGESLGVDTAGTSRQASWIDYDGDGDSDLFVAMRDRANKLYRNDGTTFTDVSNASNMADARRSVGSVWFDFDRDGDLDMYTANQSGDRDGFYRNDDGIFTEIADTLQMDLAGRPLKEGSVGATLCDVNSDGWLDLFVPVYGPDRLYIADGKGGFANRAKQWGVEAADDAVSADCADFDNDGRDDLYVVAYRPGEVHGRDHLYHNRGSHFVDVLPADLRDYDGDHGVRWADYDNDGDMDLAITNRHKNGRHSVLRNDLAGGENAHFIKITVLDKKGYYTRQGDEVRVYDSSSKQLIATRIVDTGGGYISQNIMPVHVGIGCATKVDVEITFMGKAGRTKSYRKEVKAGSSITVRKAD